MEFSDKFKFLNMQLNKRKNDDNSFYLVVNLLDKENNPCKFFCFNNEIISAVTSRNYQALQDVTVNIGLSYTNNGWNIRLNDMIPYNNK